MQPNTNKILTNDIKSLAMQLGADLVGVAPAERFKEAPEKLRPESHLTGAKNVISIAMHIPDATIDMWAKPPGEPVLPYHTFGHGLLSMRLCWLQFDVVKRIERAGYYALPIISTQAYGERMHAEISHRHAAVAAGMGEFGRHALVLTPEYGPRQRFTSIITDAPLEPDPLYSGPRLCDDCNLCIDACPMQAISKDENYVIKIEDRTFEYAKTDPWRCWWAELFGLIEESGPKYLGMKTNIRPPEKITPEILLEAASKRDPWQVVSHSLGWCGHCLRKCTAGKKSCQKRHKERKG